MKKQLIFVYNARGEMFSQVADYLHKMFSPKSYACSLCSLTHTNFGAKSDWKEFINTLDVEVEYFHKNDFYRKYPTFFRKQYPAVFLKEEFGEPYAIINHSELNEISNLEDLKLLIQQRIKE
jgi:hypothetical protein